MQYHTTSTAECNYLGKELISREPSRSGISKLRPNIFTYSHHQLASNRQRNVMPGCFPIILFYRVVLILWFRGV